MWQVLLAAAVAGSTGFVAKHLLGPNANLTTEKCGDQHQEEEEENTVVEDAKFQSPLVLHGSIETGYESNCEKQDGIFRFSSSESGGKSGSRSAPKILRKKLKFGSSECQKGTGVEKVDKRFSIYLKRRKTSKNVAVNCGSCSSKGNSLFGWGLGVGMMYMMSAGKAEISKLNTAMDETAKVVQELKTELYNRKSSRKLQVSGSADEVAANSNEISGKHTQVVLSKSSTENKVPNDIKVFVPPVIDDGEYASSVLTEEPGPEELEMARLEAELESELQKLPCCITGASCDEGMRSNLSEFDQRNVVQSEVSIDGIHELEGQSSDSYQCHGVMPSELDKKLCHVLIEQQETQIVELESELYSAQSKLQEKEAELQALKDCVRRLTKFSLSTVSDDEPEAQEEQDCTNEWDYNIKMGSESRKSLVGMKRPIDS